MHALEPGYRKKSLSALWKDTCHGNMRKLKERRGVGFQT